MQTGLTKKSTSSETPPLDSSVSTSLVNHSEWEFFWWVGSFLTGSHTSGTSTQEIKEEGLGRDAAAADGYTYKTQQSIALFQEFMSGVSLWPCLSWHCNDISLATQKSSTMRLIAQLHTHTPFSSFVAWKVGGNDTIAGCPDLSLLPPLYSLEQSPSCLPKLLSNTLHWLEPLKYWNNTNVVNVVVLFQRQRQCIHATMYLMSYLEEISGPW